MDPFHDISCILVKFDCGITHINCTIFVTTVIMVDFISAFCTVLPIVIVSVLLALTWSSFNGRRAGLRPLARSGRGAGKKSRRFRQHTKAEWEDNKLYKAEMLILPVSLCLEDTTPIVRSLEKAD